MTDERRKEITNTYKSKIAHAYNEYRRTQNGVWKFECKCVHKQYVENTGGTMTIKQIVNESKGV